jgi:hypothetical protein
MWTDVIIVVQADLFAASHFFAQELHPNHDGRERPVVGGLVRAPR